MATPDKELRKVLISLGADEKEADTASASVVSGDEADIAELRAATKIDTSSCAKHACRSRRVRGLRLVMDGGADSRPSSP